MDNPKDCTTAGTCLVQDGFLWSPPSLVGSGLFLGAFMVLIPINFYHGMRHHTPLYSSTIIAGLLFEVVGYLGRILMNSDVSSVSGFVLYTIGTIMGPAFITSAIYQVVPHVHVLYGRRFALVSQAAYLRIMFFTFDLFTLLFQAAGIAIAVSPGQAQVMRFPTFLI